MPTSKNKDGGAAAAAAAAPQTFQSMLSALVKDQYRPAMRRAIQTVVLQEADRCLRDRYRSLRPFQRKIALFDCAADLVQSLDFIPPYHRAEIMFRTNTSKVPVPPDLIWRRMKLVSREIEKQIMPGVVPFLGPKVSFQAACDKYIQGQFEAIGSQNAGKPVPDMWEYSHIHHFLAYRMYYDGRKSRANLPPAVDPNPKRTVPNKKPDVYPIPPGEGGQKAAPPGGVYAVPAVSSPGRTEGTGGGAGTAGPQTADDARREQLREVLLHLECLKELAGAVPAEDIASKKRDLYAALPPAPLPFVDGASARAVAGGGAETGERKKRKGDKKALEGLV